MHEVSFIEKPQYVHSWIVYGEALINRHAYGSEVGQRQICVGCLNDTAGTFEGSILVERINDQYKGRVSNVSTSWSGCWAGCIIAH